MTLVTYMILYELAKRSNHRYRLYNSVNYPNDVIKVVKTEIIAKFLFSTRKTAFLTLVTFDLLVTSVTLDDLKGL